VLEYDLILPDRPADGAPLVVLLHGRGSHKGDLLSLAPHLPHGIILAAPQAAFPGAPWGFGSGWAWYAFVNNRPDPESFEASQQHLGEFLAALPALLPVRPGPLVLGGFSQGATIAMGYALRNPGSVPLVLNFSGTVPDHASVTVSPETVRGTRFFWGFGRQDPFIPVLRLPERRAALAAAGADLVPYDFDGGHWLDPGELEAAVALIRQLMAGR
jgi:phospholipase/carboxylesterase